MPQFENGPGDSSAKTEQRSGIPTMITEDMKNRLVEKGLNETEINALPPEKAWEILNNQQEGGKEKGQEKAGELSPEKTTQEPDNRVQKIEGEMTARQQEIGELTATLEETRASLNDIRSRLGLEPVPPEEGIPSTVTAEARRDQLKTEIAELEYQKEEILSSQEREKMVDEMKGKILEEQIGRLFAEFEKMNSLDFDMILQEGKGLGGRKIEIPSVGELEPEMAITMAQAFKEGARLLPEILKKLPELLKTFDQSLTQEAEKRVDEKVEEEKQKEEQIDMEQKEINKSDETLEVPPEDALEQEIAAEKEASEKQEILPETPLENLPKEEQLEALEENIEDSKKEAKREGR